MGLSISQSLKELSNSFLHFSGLEGLVKSYIQNPLLGVKTTDIGFGWGASSPTVSTIFKSILNILTAIPHIEQIYFH